MSEDQYYEWPAARVPELTGFPSNEAHDLALDAGLLAVPENAFCTAAGRAHVGRQDPEPGTSVETGSIVRIWITSEYGRTSFTEPPPHTPPISYRPRVRGWWACRWQGTRAPSRPGRRS